MIEVIRSEAVLGWRQDLGLTICEAQICAARCACFLFNLNSIHFQNVDVAFDYVEVIATYAQATQPT